MNEKDQHSRNTKNGTPYYKGCDAEESWRADVKQRHSSSVATSPNIQNALLEASRDKNKFLDLLDHLSSSERPLNMVNISTISNVI